MASTVTELTVRAIESNSYDALSTTVGLVAILALITLLVLREALKATGTPEVAGRVGLVTPLALPLLAPWVLVISGRLIDLL